MPDAPYGILGFLIIGLLISGAIGVGSIVMFFLCLFLWKSWIWTIIFAIPSLVFIVLVLDYFIGFSQKIFN